MTILYPYDFSETATEAALGAAAIASCLKAPLLLVHVVDPKLRSLPSNLQEKLDAATHGQLDGLAGQLRTEQPGLDARAVQLHGDIVDELNALATRERSQLLILAARKHAEGRPGSGSVSGRIAQAATVPVLVLRESRPWQDWAARRRPLRAVLGVSRDGSSGAAVEMTTQLRTAAPCDVIATQVYFAPELATHYGLGHINSPYRVTPEPELEQLVERDLTKRISDLRGSGDIRIRSKLSVTGTANHLLDVAERERADVVIVGRRSSLAPFRIGSVSDAVLQEGRMSVLIVPASARESRADGLPQLQRVLAATDLSSFGNQAVRFAMALVQASGGELHLLHVGDAQVPDWDDEVSLAAQLRSLVPQRWPFPVSTAIIFGRQPSAAIAGAAERIDADVICVASHGRRGIARAALGSVAEDLMRKAHRPVLVVRPAEE
jgi:nucleotide-binding universal stress UspA family protein